MPTRNAEAVWGGDLTTGKGTISLGSKAFSGSYDWRGRSGDGAGTNPEELIAAAHSAAKTPLAVLRVRLTGREQYRSRRPRQ